MSGRWVWVPGGWRVVPEVPTDEMLDAWDAAERAIGRDDETVYRAIIATAPEPPSGWRQGDTCEGKLSNDDGPYLVFYKGKTFIGWPAIPEHWTPLPPPPEVKP